jgi:hypothetical protein
LHVDGDDAVYWSDGETPADPFMLASGTDETLYAVYQFTPVAAQPEQLVLNLNGSSGTVYVGVSDYDAGQWAWTAVTEPFSEWMEVALPGSTLWSDGSLWVCLVVHGGDTLSFHGANLETPSAPVLDADSWSYHIIGDAEGANYGKYHAATLGADNKPVVAFTRDDFDDIYFAQCSETIPGAQTDWYIHSVDTADNLGGGVSVAIGASGYPVVAYEDTNRQDVYWAIADTTEPVSSANWQAHNPDNNAIAQPQVSYDGTYYWMVYLGLGGDIMWTRSDTVPNPSLPEHWSAPAAIADTENYDYLSLAMHPDGPMLAYQSKEGGPQRLYFAWWNQIAGAGEPEGFTTLMVDEKNTNSGKWVKLTLDSNNFPWIGYTNVDVVDYMRFAMADTATPASAANFTKVDAFYQSQTHTGQWLDIAEVSGKPFYSFIETGSGSVDGLFGLYANTDPDGITGEGSFDHELLYTPGPSEMVNEETEVLLLDNGAPAIIFRSNEGLTCAVFGGTLPPG